MIHTLLYAALWLLSLFAAFKWGQASEVGRAIKIEREPLAAPEFDQGRADNGAPDTSPGPAPSRSSSLYDREADHAGEGLYLLPRRGTPA